MDRDQFALCLCEHHWRDHYNKVVTIGGNTMVNTGCAKRTKLRNPDSECQCVRFKEDLERYQKRIV